MFGYLEAVCTDEVSVWGESAGKGLTRVSEIRTRLLDTLHQGLLALADPHTRVVILRTHVNRCQLSTARISQQRHYLLVGLVRTLGVADLRLQVA